MTTFERDAFARLAGVEERASKAKLLEAIESLGFRPDDPRLKPHLAKLADEFTFGDALVLLQNSPLLKRCLLGGVSASEWATLSATALASFNAALKQAGDRGACAAYIEPLKNVSPALRGAALCTVHGQRWAHGDSQVAFTIQSVSKVINYAVALETLGLDVVQTFVDVEPSGTFFNDLVLLPGGIPHNPFINAGAIMTCCHLYRDLPQFERFERVEQVWNKLSAGGGTPPMGFSHDVYLAERDTADRNYTLVYMMKEAGSLPRGPGGHVEDSINLYLSFCSLANTCEALSVVAATLANWGVNPFTSERVFSTATVRSVCSLMTTCGLYDGSSTFQASLELPCPAKSGVAGALLVVVPGKFGLCTFSPRLDDLGNTVFGVEMTRALVSRLVHVAHPAPNMAHATAHQHERILLHACATGNLARVASLLAQGWSVLACDFDLRTPLHVAAARGDVAIVRLLLAAGASTVVVDRYGRTPLDDASANPVIEALMRAHAPRDSVTDEAASEASEEQERLLYSARLLAEATEHAESDAQLAASAAASAAAGAGDAKEETAARQKSSFDMEPPDLHRSVSRGDIYRFQREQLGVGHSVPCADVGRFVLALSAWGAVDCAQRVQAALNASGLDHVKAPALLLHETDEAYVERALGVLPVLVPVLEGRLAVPDWASFTTIVSEIAQACRDAPAAGGQVAQYSAVLSRADPEHMAVAVCSTSGQMASFGPPRAASSVSLQSCFKPFTYAMALQSHGFAAVSAKVGNEPSGQAFNHLGLNKQGRAHNALINAGGLAVSSFVDFHAPQRDRFKLFSDVWRAMTNSAASITHDLFLTEMLSANRNLAIAHLLKSTGAFCEGTVMDPAQVFKAVEFYSILCSVTCPLHEAALAAGCLANGGVSVLTGERVFSEEVARRVVDIMRYAGCAQDSGWVFFSCGFGVKTGASGLVIGVIPGVAGFAVHAPALNAFGNSVKGLDFCSRLAQRLAVHVFEQPAGRGVRNPSRWKDDDGVLDMEMLCWACVQGDQAQVLAMAEAGLPMNATDHDGRTALHVAAGEGRVELCRLLYKLAPECLAMKDYRGNTPLDEARAMRMTHTADALLEVSQGAATEGAMNGHA